MFEFDKYSGPEQSTTRPERTYEPFAGASERALLLWSEHCIECAAPDCFKTCDLYVPRPDRRCRRFVHGIFRNKAFRSAHGYGAEVIFKKWGKVEARGNATLYPERHVRVMESSVEMVSRALNPVGRALGRMLGDIRWSYLSFALSERLNTWLHRRRDPTRLPDAFVVEIYNPTSSPVVFTLSMSINRGQLKSSIPTNQLPPPFMRKMTVPPGHFVEKIPLSAFRAIVESGLPFSIALTPSGDVAAHAVFLTLDFVRERVTAANQPAAAGAPEVKLKPAKCVVFDLDNTVWDGILVEGSVELRQGVLDLFRELDARGILISVASKNAHDEAIRALVEFGLEEYLLFPQINWGPKSASLKRIAADIDIGLDTFVYVDDNPFERDEVRQALPMIETLPDTALSELLAHPRLAGSTTAEAGKRRLMYRDAMQRQNAAISFGDDYLAFLRTCGIQLEIRPPRRQDFERIAELVQRTNQLNFSGRSYQRDEISRILADSSVEAFVMTCEDRFGSYGMIGFCLSAREGNSIRVLDLMLSCRVQGKFIEQALFHQLTHRPGWTADFLKVEFQRTSRNALAEAVLEKLGFRPLQGGGQGRKVRVEDAAPDFIATTGPWLEHAMPVDADQANDELVTH